MRTTIKELRRKPPLGSNSGVRTFGGRTALGNENVANGNEIHARLGRGMPTKIDKTSWIDCGLQPLCIHRIQSDLIKAVFDSEARIIYAENSVFAAGTGHSNIVYTKSSSEYTLQ